MGNLFKCLSNALKTILMEKNTTDEVQCITCKQFLPLSEFRSYKNQSGSIGYRRYCRECELKQGRERYHGKKRMQCNVCKQVLPLSKFRNYKNQSGSVRYRRSCRNCEAKAEYIRCQKRKSQLSQEDNFRFLDFYRKMKGV